MADDHCQPQIWRPFELPTSRAERDRIRITALESSDADAVFAMLGRCSLTTLYHRFHGMTDGISHATHVLANAADQSSYAAWNIDQCVGLASLAGDRDGSAHVGVLVEDLWQRRGVGSALLGALVAQARKRRLTSFVAEVLADNQYLLPLLARTGPTTTSFGYGGYRVRVGLEADGMVTPPASPRWLRRW